MEKTNGRITRLGLTMIDVSDLDRALQENTLIKGRVL